MSRPTFGRQQLASQERERLEWASQERERLEEGEPEGFGLDSNLWPVLRFPA